MSTPDTGQGLLAASLTHLDRLIAFDTTSALSNLALIDYVAASLAESGIEARRVAPPGSNKANLFATVGQLAPGGVILSGHTDVVPVEGQSWASDPFSLTRRDDRLYGRGTSDMKGFLACALAAVPLLKARCLRPITLAFSYDEEIGCLGAPAMIEAIARDLPPMSLAIIGEPTMMEVVTGHKGVSIYQIAVRGREGHSSRPDLGCSAIPVALDLMAILQDIAGNAAATPDWEGGFQPPCSTVTIGVVRGGTAANILARDCSFMFDVRVLPATDPKTLLAPFFAAVEVADKELKCLGEPFGVRINKICEVPPLTPCNHEAAAIVQRLSGKHAPPGNVSYSTEAGQFQKAGFPTVVCGPGSIEVAHKTDEFVALDQIKRCCDFMVKLADVGSE